MNRPPTFPARPTNGGPFPLAPSKRGSWLAEPKYNGVRILLELETGLIWNRHNSLLATHGDYSHAVATINKQYSALRKLGVTWLDVEGLGRVKGGRLDSTNLFMAGSVVVLDMIGAKDFAQQERTNLLNTFWDTLKIGEEGALRRVYRPPAVFRLGEDSHTMNLWTALEKRNNELGIKFYEGVVMKRVDATYPMQNRSENEKTTAWVKHRWNW